MESLVLKRIHALGCSSEDSSLLARTQRFRANDRISLVNLNRTYLTYRTHRLFMTYKLLLVTILAAWPTALIAQNQSAAAPQSKLVQFQMAILKHGPKWSASPDPASSVRQQHVAYAQSLLKSGKA